MNASHETTIVIAAVIAVVSAIVAVIGAFIANRSARAAMKSAYTTMMSAQKKYGVTLLPAATNLVNQNIDRTKNFIEAIDTPLATVLTLVFSIALGVSLSILLSRSDSPSALVPTAAAPASPALVSASPPLTSTASAPKSMVSASPSPPPTSAATAPAYAAPPSTSTAPSPDHSEDAGLLARGCTYLSDGDVASARVSLSRAAERDDPQAAFALGGTYDPTELKRIGIPNFRSHADLAKAREWYSRAADLGSAHASSRLAELYLRGILAGSGWLADLYREGVEPSGSLRKVSGHMVIPLSCPPDAR
jgi:hypothetical protein